MKKVKRLGNKTSIDLENSINRWLKEHGNEIKILDISYVAYKDILICLILYKDDT